jgi:Protein of unknown function (DUF2924)
MKRPLHADHEGLAQKLAELTHLSRNSLAEQWAAIFGAAPPPRTSRPLMIRAVAYKMQERMFGGLPASTRRMLLGESGTARAPGPSRQASPGTVLLREWQGATHQVIVAEGGVLYRGQRYRSLSKVARLITGSRWSGPAFFGLKKHGPF